MTREEVDAETEALILWAWQHRQALDLEPGEGFPESQQRVVKAFWEILALFPPRFAKIGGEKSGGNVRMDRDSTDILQREEWVTLLA
jgi:hypothetical protein